MEYAIMLLGLLAIGHFAYESIVLPSYRMKLRNDMFVLRDELRDLKISKDPTCEDAAFDVAHEGINNYLDRLHQVTISLHKRFEHAYQHNPTMREAVERRRKAVKDSQCEPLKSIVDRANNTIESAFLANSAAWFVYLLPVMICALAFGILSAFAGALFATPARQTEQFVGDDTVAV